MVPVEEPPERPYPEPPQEEADYLLGRLSAIVFGIVVVLISLGIALERLAEPIDRTASGTILREMPGMRQQQAVAQPTPVPTQVLGPRTRAMVNLHAGPSEDYAVIGLLPSGASLEIVGRDWSGLWLAVSVAPGASFYGWMEARKALGVPAIESLDVAPVTLFDSITRR